MTTKQMGDAAIIAALAEVGAAWLMDPDDEACQAKAIRHLVDASTAAERDRCAPLLKRLEEIACGVRLYGAPDAGLLADRIDRLCQELRL